jgi:hypothetical protein
VDDDEDLLRHVLRCAFGDPETSHGPIHELEMALIDAGKGEPS